MMNYVIYYRVSTKKQGESGLGLDAQRAYVTHFYRDKTILAEFTDVKSGSDVTRRSELCKALTLCKQHLATLVVAKIDRLSRNTEQALQIYSDLSGRLESCDIPNLDKFTLTLFMAIADRERELISLRTKQALDQKRERIGEWRKGGFHQKQRQASQLGVAALKATAQANQNSRKALAFIKALRATGKTLTQIAEELNESGFVTPRGLPFRAVQVKRLLERVVTPPPNPAVLTG